MWKWDNKTLLLQIFVLSHRCVSLCPSPTDPHRKSIKYRQKHDELCVCDALTYCYKSALHFHSSVLKTYLTRNVPCPRKYQTEFKPSMKLKVNIKNQETINSIQTNILNTWWVRMSYLSQSGILAAGGPDQVWVPSHHLAATVNHQLSGCEANVWNGGMRMMLQPLKSHDSTSDRQRQECTKKSQMSWSTLCFLFIYFYFCIFLKQAPTQKAAVFVILTIIKCKFEKGLKEAKLIDVRSKVNTKEHKGPLKVVPSCLRRGCMR